MKWAVVGINVFLLILPISICVGLDQGLVCYKNSCFYVELAQTPEERARGLMFREHLDPDKGMLFIYQAEEKGERSIWMENTLIPLDIIWINQDQEVVFISPNTQPCTAQPCTVIKPDVKARYILELNAQTAEKIGLRVGERLEFDIDKR